MNNRTANVMASWWLSFLHRSYATQLEYEKNQRSKNIFFAELCAAIELHNPSEELGIFVTDIPNEFLQSIIDKCGEENNLSDLLPKYTWMWYLGDVRKVMVKSEERRYECLLSIR